MRISDWSSDVCSSDLMAIAREEIFGPVLSTLTFTDEDEAIRIANDTIYGLAAAVWTPDINKALQAARSLRAGSVWVNCFDGGDITTSSEARRVGQVRARKCDSRWSPYR